MTTYSRGYDAVRIGVIGLVATAAFIGLFFYMTDRAFAVSRPSVFVRLSSAAGLRKGDPVFYRGVQVGRIGQLTFMREGDVLLRMGLDQPLPLTTEAHAEIVALDLFGRQSVVLRDGDRFAPKLEPADTLVGAPMPSMTGKMADIGARAERMLSDTMVSLLRETLTGSAALTHQMAALSATVNRLVESQHGNVTAMTAEFASIARNVNTATAPDELVQTRGNLNRATARLDSATTTLALLLGGMENGEGSAGKLLRDEGLYNRTESLLGSLEELVRDVKANPKRYINVKVF